LFIVAGTSGCASQEVKKHETRMSDDNYAQTRKALETSRNIAPGNTLHITHSGDSKIAGDYKVDFDGQIQMPYKVTLQAGGLTTSELRDQVQRAYQSFVKGSSSVEVEIKDRSVLVEVRGDVKNPGRYPVRIDMPLEELVSLAGGFVSAQGGNTTNVKRPEYIGIERQATEGEISANRNRNAVWFHLSEYYFEFDTESDFLWRGGEKIFFQDSAPSDANIKNNWQSVTVMGEVRDPKDLPVLPNGDLLTYVSRAGGLMTSANLSEIEVIHRNGDTRETVNLVTDRMVNEIKAGDVIVVRAVDVRPSTLDKIATYLSALATVTLSVVAIIILP
jgi:protein involved in polysaccharide export with SLBB domain